MTRFFLPLLISLCSLGEVSATHIPAGSTIGGPQVIAGMYNGQKDYFDAGVRCLEFDPERDVEVIFNEVATVNLSSNIDFKDIEKELSRGAGGDITLNSGDDFG